MASGVNGLGYIATFTYDGNRLRTGRHDALRNRCPDTREPSGNGPAAQDPLGFVVTYTYVKAEMKRPPSPE